MAKDWTHGFYKRSAQERRNLVKQARTLSDQQAQTVANQATQLGDQLVENYLTDYRLPEGLLVGLVVNGQDYTLPMVTEEPSVIAAASNGSQRVAKSGGFVATAGPRALVGQVVLCDVVDFGATKDWLLDHQEPILAVANAAHPSMQKRGAGAKGIRVRIEPPFVSLDLLVDVSEAMGANSVNTMAEAVGTWLKERGYQVLTAILSNLATDSLQTVTCQIDLAHLATSEMDGVTVAKRIALMSDLAQVDVYRATTHNKGIMNGIDALVLASGNDWRAIEAGAHAYAAKDGHYRGLATWQFKDGRLVGELTLPMPVGVVGGSIKLTPQSQVNYQISQIKSAKELAGVIVAGGLAQNLAALRALATAGIQAGHMKLQYRSLALSVGATTAEAPVLAKQLAAAGHADRQVASELLAQLRKEAHDGRRED